MTLSVADRIFETCAAPGLGAITLLGALSTYRPFSTLGDGAETFYAIVDQSGVNWEVGAGVYSATGNTLSRVTVYSSSSGAKVNFTSGAQNVFLPLPAGRAVVSYGGSVVVPDSAMLAVLNGGTGLSTPGAVGNWLVSNGGAWVSTRPGVNGGTF